VDRCCRACALDALAGSAADVHLPAFGISELQVATETLVRRDTIESDQECVAGGTLLDQRQRLGPSASEPPTHREPVHIKCGRWKGRTKRDPLCRP
jgi:hypothetical protein